MDGPSDRACQLARAVESAGNMGAGRAPDAGRGAACDRCLPVLDLVLAACRMFEARVRALELAVPAAKLRGRRRGKGRLRPGECVRCGATYLRKSAVGRYCPACKPVVSRAQARARWHATRRG